MIPALTHPSYLVAIMCLGMAGAANAHAPSKIRIASYNIALYGETASDVSERLRDQHDKQAKSLAYVIQTARPDVVLLCEIDHDPQGQVLDLFVNNYVESKTEATNTPIRYPYRYSIPSNTGLPSSLDINSNGKSTDPEDAWGFGRYPGQYAMAVISRYPIDFEAIRTFQTMLWSDMPGALRPRFPNGTPFHNDKLWKQLRLSSKNHADVPVLIGKQRVHLLVSHPTPPVFDGPEDRNGARNHDEIRFWIDYVDDTQADYMVDDSGQSGGLSIDAPFVIAGDLNSDPDQGDSRQDAIQRLLEHRRVTDTVPTNDQDSYATAAFRHGPARVDYALPSSNLTVVDSGVIWPMDEESKLSEAVKASDHRLVWIDVELPKAQE